MSTLADTLLSGLPSNHTTSPLESPELRTSGAGENVHKTSKTSL